MCLIRWEEGKSHGKEGDHVGDGQKTAKHIARSDDG